MCWVASDLGKLCEVKCFLLFFCSGCRLWRWRRAACSWRASKRRFSTGRVNRPRGRWRCQFYSFTASVSLQKTGSTSAHWTLWPKQAAGPSPSTCQVSLMETSLIFFTSSHASGRRPQSLKGFTVSGVLITWKHGGEFVPVNHNIDYILHHPVELSFGRTLSLNLLQTSLLFKFSILLAWCIFNKNGFGWKRLI